MFMIKLGGSVITDKTRKNTFQKEITQRLALEIRDSGKRTILVHGAGSFGHILAKKYELNKGLKNQEQLKGLAEVQRDVKDLNLRVLDVFLESGVNAVSLAPSCFLINERGSIKHMDTSIFKKYFDMGVTPVTFGDVVTDESLAFSIVSGDQLMFELASAFNPEKVIFVADVDGIFSGTPTDEESEFLPVVSEGTLSNIGKGEDGVDDVTGSIFGKLEIMFDIAALGLETIILNGTVENRLRDSLEGKDVKCTKIRKGKKEGI